MQALLVGVPEVKIKVSHRRFSSLTQGFDILDDRRADKRL
jgi:hypothetical protein